MIFSKHRTKKKKVIFIFFCSWRPLISVCGKLCNIQVFLIYFLWWLIIMINWDHDRWFAVKIMGNLKWVFFFSFPFVNFFLKLKIPFPPQRGKKKKQLNDFKSLAYYFVRTSFWILLIIFFSTSFISTWLNYHTFLILLIIFVKQKYQKPV